MRTRVLVPVLLFMAAFALASSAQENCFDAGCIGFTSGCGCTGEVAGRITDAGNISVINAQVSVLSGSAAVNTTATNSTGAYALDVECGTYNLVAEREEFVPFVQTDVVVLPGNQTTSNFSLVPVTSCEADCTYAGDETLHASCNGVNGCGFYDSTAAQACNLARRGWFRNYNSTHEVECPLGLPQKKSRVAATVSCGAKSLVKSSAIVLYKGKPVKMVVAVCG